MNSSYEKSDDSSKKRRQSSSASSRESSPESSSPKGSRMEKSQSKGLVFLRIKAHQARRKLIAPLIIEHLLNAMNRIENPTKGKLMEGSRRNRKTKYPKDEYLSSDSDSDAPGEENTMGPNELEENTVRYGRKKITEETLFEDECQLLFEMFT
ncbi:hypothetical protein Trydic_g14560 [Trypoxylus dichotomus]